MRNDQIPTIPAIQRMNAILVAVTAGLLFFFDSTAAAVGCLLGGAIVIVNLWLLSLIGAAILAAAGAGISGTAAKFGVMAIPLKMLIVVGLVFHCLPAHEHRRRRIRARSLDSDDRGNY